MCLSFWPFTYTITTTYCKNYMEEGQSPKRALIGRTFAFDERGTDIPCGKTLSDLDKPPCANWSPKVKPTCWLCGRETGKILRIHENCKNFAPEVWKQKRCRECNKDIGERKKVKG